TVIAKKARAVISDTRICASSRDGFCYRYLLDRCRGRQIIHQYWHFLTASSRSPRGRTLTMPVVDGLHHQYFRGRGSPRGLIEWGSAVQEPISRIAGSGPRAASGHATAAPPSMRDVYFVTSAPALATWPS